MTAPKAMTASTFFDAASRRTTSGSSKAPGTRTRVTFLASAPCRTSASMAPSTRRSPTKWLKRLATTAKRAPLGTMRFPSMVRVVIAHALSVAPVGSGRSFAAPPQRELLDHVEPEAMDACNLTRVIGQKADLLQSQVDQHLGAQPELAERGIVRGARGRRRVLLLRPQCVELGAYVALGGDVDQRPASGGLDLGDGFAQVAPAVT